MYNNQRSRQIIERDYTIGSHQSGPSNRFNISKPFRQYLLNGDATESSGLNNGTPNNISWVSEGIGYINKCARLNGTTAYIGSTTLLNGLSDFSVSIWIKTSADGYAFSQAGSGSTDKLYVLYLSSTTNGSDSSFFTTSGSGLGTILFTHTHGVWTNYIIVANGSTGTLYRNGVSIGSGTITGKDTSTTTGFEIGRRLTTYTSCDVGLCNIYDKALSNKERQILYKEGLNLLH